MYVFRTNNSLLFFCFFSIRYAILGLSEQYLMNKITETTYVTECGDLQNHVSRLTHDITSRNEGENLPVHIELEKEYPFNK